MIIIIIFISDLLYTINHAKWHININKLQSRIQHAALYGSACCARGHAVTLTFDFLTQKIQTFILVPKCLNAESLVKSSPVIFKILH